MMAMYAASRRRRPSFVDFFENEESEDGVREIQVLQDSNGHPASSRGFSVDVTYRQRFGDDEIEVRRQRGDKEIPEHGWIRLAGDGGSHVSLRRQVDARMDALRKTGLVDQLADPFTIRGMTDRWRDAGDGLGESTHIVHNMLVSQPFYALQGPPGTGKTEVAAHAIAAYLRRERGSRVLVSAQSNFALDNLAERILERLDAVDERGKPRQAPYLLPLRIVSESSRDRVSDRIKPYQLHDLVDRRVGELKAHAKYKLTTTEERLRPVLTDWLRTIEESGPELTDRLQRGANLVFAHLFRGQPRAARRVTVGRGVRLGDHRGGGQGLADRAGDPARPRHPLDTHR